VILVFAFLLGGAWGAGTIAILVLMPVAMGSATPVVRRWVHDQPKTSGERTLAS